MIESILRLAINRRYLVLSLLLVIIGVGMWSYQKLPIDAVPDITNVQVQINTSAPGYSPLEAEQRVTFPIETALNFVSPGHLFPFIITSQEPSSLKVKPSFSLSHLPYNSSIL